MVKSQWTQSMKQLFHKLKDYLPQKHINNPSYPILCISDGKNIRFLYSFDHIKKVAYTSDAYFKEYDYMSIFEIYYDGWELINKDKVYNLLVPECFDIPF